MALLNRNTTMPIDERFRVMNDRIDDISVKLDSHNHTLEAHMVDFVNHEAEEVYRHQQFLDSQTKNTAAITELTKSVAGVIEVYETASSLGRFIRWSAGIVISIATIILYFKTMR